ncbi:MAG: sensor histidine kinase [Ruminococcus sp.]|jgi:two-component system sensor histidine kinase YesM
MKKWMDRFQVMTLDRKIKILLTIGIILSASVVLMISTVSSVSSLTSKSEGLVKSNVETVSKSLESVINNYYSIATSLIPDENIQAYLKEESGSERYSMAREDSRISVSLALSQQEDINFIGLYKNEKEYLYRGISITKSNFTRAYQEDLKKSVLWGRGDLRISYGDAYYGKGEYTLSFYQPVYDMNRIGRTIGTFCINVKEEVFGFLNNRSLSNLKYDVFLIEKGGNVLFCDDENLVGRRLKLNSVIDGEKGDFREKGKLYVYERIDDSDLYVLGTIDIISMISDSLGTMLLLVVTVLVIVAIALVMVSKVVKRYYEPMENLVAKMDQVSRGNLEIRMEEEHTGQDFVTISNCFNRMMDDINRLMEQVKEEQHQIEQIKFNALQSQIKPHFLYNVLDCIHWQAVAEGNKKISVFVKALANYYRICLSKGRDIISLKEELEHVKNYLIIQNIRYENILEGEFLIDAGYMDVKIPKMTLQPMIENAIYHGMKVEAGRKGRVILSAWKEEDCIVVAVKDNGQGMSREKVEEMNRSISCYDENFGYGIRNVNRRIELLFGKQYGLHYEINDLGGITVKIKLPDQRTGS